MRRQDPFSRGYAEVTTFRCAVCHERGHPALAPALALVARYEDGTLTARLVGRLPRTKAEANERDFGVAVMPRAIMQPIVSNGVELLCRACGARPGAKKARLFAMHEAAQRGGPGHRDEYLR